MLQRRSTALKTMNLLYTEQSELSFTSTTDVELLSRRHRENNGSSGRLAPLAGEHSRSPAGGQSTSDVHRINNSVEHTTADSNTSNPALSVEALAAAAAFARPRLPDSIPDVERANYRLQNSLRQFYDAWMLQGRRDRVQAGTLSRASLEKDNQALNWFESHSRPPAFSGPWSGLPFLYINDDSMQRVFAQASAAGLAAGTIKSWWFCLRGILNEAVRRGAIDKCPRVRLADADPERVRYTSARITQIWEQLSNNPKLQVAFALSVSCGLRPVDLFLLRWEQIERGDKCEFVRFTARKTAKQQRLPLHPVISKQLNRLRVFDTELIFDGLTSPASKDPERCRPARVRNELMKRALQDALADEGINVFADRSPWSKPWQIGRLTCNERCERHMPGLGEFILGHASQSLNARSYREPSGMIIDGVLSLDPPECFVI